MDEYLKPTELCDCDNVELQRKAKEIIKDAANPKEAAVKIFYFVRDQILFGLDYPNAKASHTLKKGIGFCFNKPNLQIALLRAVRIAARCHYVHLPKEVLKAINPRVDKLPTATIGHPWCECYLSGEWVACEALFDEALYKAFPKEQVPSTIDWDGQNNLILTKPLIAEDVGTFPSLDEMLEFVAKEEKGKVGMPPEPPKILGWFVFFLANRHINKIRKQ